MSTINLEQCHCALWAVLVAIWTFYTVLCRGAGWRRLWLLPAAVPRWHYEKNFSSSARVALLIFSTLIILPVEMNFVMKLNYGKVPLRRERQKGKKEKKKARHSAITSRLQFPISRISVEAFITAWWSFRIVLTTTLITDTIWLDV